jgi:hypothetical protein
MHPSRSNGFLIGSYYYYKKYSAREIVDFDQILNLLAEIAQLQICLGGFGLLRLLLYICLDSIIRKTSGHLVPAIRLNKSCGYEHWHGSLRCCLGASWIANRFQTSLFTRPNAIEPTGILVLNNNTKYDWLIAQSGAISLSRSPSLLLLCMCIVSTLICCYCRNRAPIIGLLFNGMS